MNYLQQITTITLYTGSNGKKGCTCKCPGCTQSRYGLNHPYYQGTLEQLDEILNLLPNLKNIYFLGNPDISVDTEFCNTAAKHLINKKYNVMFSTSGYGGINTIKKLLSGLDPKYVSYISFSVDSLIPKVSNFLKGQVVHMDDILDSIDYCNENEFTVKIQPTLWSINQSEAVQIMEFFKTYNINWFSFHVGSFEAIPDMKDKLHHITPNDWFDTRNSIIEYATKHNLKVSIPKIFLTETELDNLKSQKTYCSNGSAKLQIWMEEDFLRATFCPLLTEVNSLYSFKLCSNSSPIFIKDCSVTDCPIAKHFLDDNVYNIIGKSNLHSCCRYISSKVNC